MFTLILPVHLEPRLHLRMEIDTLPRLIACSAATNADISLIFPISLLPDPKSFQTMTIIRVKRTFINIVPGHLHISPGQYIPMHACAPSQYFGFPLPGVRNFQLHPTTHRLCNAKSTAQSYHFEILLGALPPEEAGFEWMSRLCRSWGRDIRVT